MPKTAKYLGVDPWEPQQNVDGGATYIRVDRFGTYELALSAYNAGPAMEETQRHSSIEETQTYVKRVMEYYELFLRSHRYNNKIQHKSQMSNNFWNIPIR